jgi:hypothetical protein
MSECKARPLVEISSLVPRRICLYQDAVDSIFGGERNQLRQELLRNPLSSVLPVYGHPHDLSLRRPKKEDGSSNDLRTIEGNKDTVVGTVSADIIEVLVERFIDGAPALGQAVQHERSEGVLHRGIKMSDPKAVLTTHAGSIAEPLTAPSDR